MGPDLGKSERYNTLIFKGTVIVILFELLIQRGACQIYNSILLIVNVEDTVNFLI